MAALPQRQPWDMAQTTWAQAINPVLSNPIVNGVLVHGIALASGDNTINHKLGRKPQGYVITDMFGAYAQVYRKTSNYPDLTLVLNASAPTTVSLYVF
jgi:hypothetical protein